jgi:ATP-dependent exoDNAse (exonuclease V) beta subunit
MNFKHIPNKKLIEVSKQTKDKKYLSVTGLTGKVSEKAILEWRKKVGEETANKIMTESSNRGTSIHNFCEHYLQNESIMIPEQNIPEYYTFKAMKPELNKINNIWGLEIPLWSDEYKLKGRADCIAEYNGVLSMIDFKTSKKVKKKEWIKPYFLQATAYIEMVKEHTNQQIEQIVLIFGITNYNITKVEISKPEHYLLELNRLNTQFNSSELSH